LTLNVVVTSLHLGHDDVIVAMETLNTPVLSVFVGTMMLPSLIDLDEIVVVVVVVVFVVVVVVVVAVMNKQTKLDSVAQPYVM